MTESQDVLDLRAKIANGGSVYLERGKRYYFNDTLQVNKPVRILGDQRDFSYLDFSQMNDPTKNLVELDRIWGYEIANLTITGKKGVNTGVGIWNSTRTQVNGQYGTVSGSAIFSHLIISYCGKGIQIGDRNLLVAGSENIYDAIAIFGVDTCLELNDLNTLNHTLRMLQMGECNYGLKTNGASYIMVDGGSISACKGVAFDMAACSAAMFRAVRMEDSNMFLRGGTTTTTNQYTVELCEMHQRKGLSTENTSLWANGWKSAIAIGGSAILICRNNFFSMQGGMSAVLDVHNSAGGAIVMTDNTCYSDLNPSPTALVSVSPNSTARKYYKRNMAVTAGAQFQAYYPDIDT